MDAPASLDYYSTPGVMTDPGEYSFLLDDLPQDARVLAKVVQGLLMHPFETDLYDVELTRVSRQELQIRTVAEMLARIHEMDSRPLIAGRDPKERLVGNCRDFATLFCAFLRCKDIPARARAGFASYLGQGDYVKYMDHWVTEYWNAEAGCWIMVDAQVDEPQRMKHHILFDTFNLKPEHFSTAGKAWILCREGHAKSGEFGFNNKLRGMSYIRTSLLRDLASLNKVEVLAWDNWWELGRKADEKLTQEDKVLLDHLAHLTVNVGDSFEELRQAFEEEPQFILPVKSKILLLEIGNPSSSASTQPPSLQNHNPFTGGMSGDPQPALFTLPPPTLTPTRLSSSTINSLQPSDPSHIVVRGAAQHNLKHINVIIPRNLLVVLTGVSGSGKSSLAFDTLYAEGQRRYVESLSSYVRRYLEQMDKPKVDYIGGLSPAISIEQKSVSKNPRSTVGTVTEVMDYMRVLYSRAGTQHCPQCGRTVAGLGAQQISDQLSSLPEQTRFLILAPVERDRKGDHSSLLEQARRDGFSRARIDGQILELDANLPVLKKSEKHTIEVVVDRMQVPEGDRKAEKNGYGDDTYVEFLSRLIDSVETALKTGKGTLLVLLENGEAIYLTEHNTCPYCEISLPELNASLFSFNAPSGMCPKCNGLGVQLQVDPNLIVDHPELSLLDGASRWYGNLRKKKNKYWLGNLDVMAQHYGVDLELSWKDLPQNFRDVILKGSGDEKFLFRFEGGDDNRSYKGESVQSFKGVVYHISRLFRQTKSDWTRRWYMSFMSQLPCPACGGTRLCAEARYVTLGGKTFPQVMSLTIEQAYEWVLSLSNGGLHTQDSQSPSVSTSHLSPSKDRSSFLTPSSVLNAEQMEIVGEVLKELTNRLRFMLNVGLHYLTLDRAAPTLSGGEGQRIRLASQLGCGLVGVLYILDEPSIGLHARDQRNLLDTLIQLRDMGNTVLVVEHDAETMRTADWLIDLGPGAGVLGGEVVASGTPEEVAANQDSLTGRYLSGKLKVTAPNGGTRRQPKGWLSVEGARLFNLKNITVRFPLGVLTVVTGVSGSGKSSLVADTLFPALQHELHGAQSTPGPHDRIVGLDQVDKVINITQDPIGRTPRSNPATYVGVFDEIRKVFATTPEARMRGYKADRFSFNVKGGRCEACHGHGWRRVEMHFLPDVWVLCQECKGARYNRHTMEVTYKGKNIADVLNMDVQEALIFFGSYPEIARPLQTLNDVGLEYVKLGQSATTLSGGEAQRVKLAKELSRASTGRTVYILDEPTTGLHFADIQRLLDVLHRLTDAGNTVIVIEHNMDVIKTADYLIDLGPEGGAAGGYIIAEGTPEEVAQVEVSYTGKYLRGVISK